MATAMFYPANYGYVNNTLSSDGDPVDVLVPTPYPLQPGSVIRCRPVGVLKMTDEAGGDAKVVAVPHTKLSKEYDHIKDVGDLPELLKAQIKHFFESYKALEAGKWVKVKRPQFCRISFLANCLHDDGLHRRMVIGNTLYSLVR